MTAITVRMKIAHSFLVIVMTLHFVDFLLSHCVSTSHTAHVILLARGAEKVDRTVILIYDWFTIMHVKIAGISHLESTIHI